MSRFAFLIVFLAGAGQASAVRPHPPQTHDGVLQTEEKQAIRAAFEQASPRRRSASARALALFAHGHALKRQQRFQEALLAFQHAWFWHPGQRRVLDEIVALAFHLDQNESAVKYAILAEELEPREPELILQLGDILLQQGDFSRAADLYAAGLGILGDDETELKTQLERDLAQACFFGEDYDRGVGPLRATIAELQRQRDKESDEQTQQAIVRELTIFLDMLGETERQRKQFAAARSAFERAASSPSSWHYWQAQLAADQGQLDEARSHLEAYVRTTPRVAGSSAWQLLLEVYPHTPEVAMQKLEAAYNRDATDRALGYFLAMRHLAAKRPADARDILEPMFHNRQTVDILRALLQCHRLDSQPSAAMALLGQLVESELELSSIDGEVEQILADTAFLDAIVRVAHQRRQSDARPLLQREALAVAMLLGEANRWQEADAFFQVALDKTDRADRESVIMPWAYHCLLHERYAEAVEHFREGLQLAEADETQVSRRDTLAMVLALDQRYAEALKVIDVGITLYPNARELVGRRAWVLQLAGQLDAARDEYLKIVSSSGDDADSLPDLIETRLALASIAAGLDDLDLAETQLLAVLAYDPEHVGAMNDLGYLWTDHDMHLPQAKRLITQAIEADPDNPAYRDSLGWLHYKLGDYQAAAADLQRAADQSDPDGVILDHLGEARHALDQPAEARQAWQQAIEAFRKANQIDSIPAIEEKLRQVDRTNQGPVESVEEE